jgi:vitamin B12 transporter
MAGYAYKYKAHSVQLNVRNDQVGLYGSKTSPGINYGMQVSSNIKANFSAATGFRAPTLEQLYSTYGSTSLKPETNRNKELGIIYIERDTSLKAVLYRNEFRNLISTNSSFYYYNVNVATVKGLTLSGSSKVWGYQLRGSYDLLNAKDGSDKALNLRAQHQATLGVDKSIGEWKLGGEWIGVGHRYYDAANSVPLSGYSLLNAITSYQINSEYKAIFRLNNLADKKYHQIAGFDASGNLSGYYSPPGRNLFVSLNWQPK